MVTADVLKDYVLGTEAVAFAPETAKVAALDLPSFADGLAQEGSNNWVVAPSRTATGRPLLANDPHRQLGVPALRYIVQLSAPGLSVIGAGEPALPGVSFGHNDFGAFGLTIFGIDQEDLYVYALNPANPDQYRYGDGWEAMTVVHDTIPVKGEAPRAVELRFTRHGPVLDYDPAHGRAFALRTVWNQPGGSGYFGSRGSLTRRPGRTSQAAHDHWGAPPLNLVWADISGTIGWAAVGPDAQAAQLGRPAAGARRRPLRVGRLPDRRPNCRSSKNPAKGWFATANEMNLPPDYPAETRKVSFEWGDRSRIDRIDEVLGGQRRTSASPTPWPCRPTATRPSPGACWPCSRPSPRRTRRWPTALARLKSLGRRRDRRQRRGGHLRGLGRQAPGARPSSSAWRPAARPVIGVACPRRHPGGARAAGPRFRSRPRRGTRRACCWPASRRRSPNSTPALGPDMGDLGLGPAASRGLVAGHRRPGRSHLERRNERRAGCRSPGARPRREGGGLRPATFDVNHGASVRMVMDVGDWDNSMVVNTPGQSGDPASPHYRDLFPLWAAGTYVPLLYSRQAVEGQAERIITVRPGA